MKKIIGIIGAMSIELDFLKSKLSPNNIEETKIAGVIFTRGTINGVSVILVQSGIGKVNAALCAQRLIIQFGVTHIINTGIAGAVADGLNVLDFVVSKDALYHDMDAVAFGYKLSQIPQMDCSDFEADKDMIKAAQDSFNSLAELKNHKLVCGRIASGDQFIGSKETKNFIKQNFEASCAEMEGAAIAHACYLDKIPFVILRCMSDNADEKADSTYSFNEEKAATLSGLLVLSMLNKI